MDEESPTLLDDARSSSEEEMEDEFPTTEGTSLDHTLARLFLERLERKRSTAAQRYLISEGNPYLEFDKEIEEEFPTPKGASFGHTKSKLASSVGEPSKSEIERGTGAAVQLYLKSGDYISELLEEIEVMFPTTKGASFGHTKSKLASSDGEPSKSGSSLKKWLPRRFLVHVLDLHLDKWTLTGVIDRKNERLWPFCIVATPDEIAVTARGEMVWIHYINGVPKRIIKTEEDIQGISATQDRLVVVGASTHLVHMYKMNGQLDCKFSTVQHEEVKDASKQVAIWPWSVTTKKNGAIIVGDVVRYVLTEHRPKDGKILRTMQVKIKPEYLAVDDDDRILVSDRHTILVVDDNGSETFAQPMIDGRLAEAYGLCCTKSAIYVVVSDDGGNTGRIHQYDNGGNFVESIALGLIGHMGITATADQRYLAIASDYRVMIYKAREEQHKVETMSTKTTSSKMPSRPTHKINEDTEDQRLQEPSHLQQVLDEVNKLTENLTASERLNSRLQLPYTAMGYFNEKGGSLSLDEYGVHLTIPRGAIAPGSPQQVYIYVDPAASPNGAGEPTVSFSPNVECGPEGLRFKESVVLSFPHHADVKSKRSDTLTPRMCQDNNSSERWEEFDGNAVITEERVILLVDHFTGFDLSGQSSKRLLIVPYGDVFDPRQGKYQIRVYVLHDDEIAKKNLEKDENKFNKLDGFKNLSWDEGDLAVKLSKLPQGCTVFEGEKQTIHEKQIMEHASNCVTFTLGIPSRPADDILYCAAEIYQYCENEDEREQSKVRLSICPDKKTPDGYAVQRSVCAEAAACSQTLVGATSDETRTSLQDTVRRGFSQLQANQSASGDPCDFGGNLFSDTCKQVEKLLHARHDTSNKSMHCGTVHGGTMIFISKHGGENTSILCYKFGQEICRVDTEKEKLSLRKVIDDSILRTLASKLGPEWERLATNLGFGKHDIYKFKNDNPHDTDNQIFQMLVKWRDERYIKEQVGQLGDELRKAQTGDIVDKLRDIDDSSLRMVSNKLGSDWESLAPSLGLDTHKVQNNFLCDSREHSFQMLVEWRDKQLSRKLLVGKLCKELKMIEKEGLADKVRELVSDRYPEEPQLLKKPQIMGQAGGDHASAIGSEPPCMITNYSQEEPISVTDPEKPPLLEKPQVLEQASGDHAGAFGSIQPRIKTGNGRGELNNNTDPEKPQPLKKPQVMEQAGGNHASVISSKPPSMITKYSQEEPISDTDPEKHQTIELKESCGNHASAIDGNQPCLNAKCSLNELISDRDSEKAPILENCAIACAIGGDHCPQLNYSLKALDNLENTREGKAEPHSQQQLRVVNRRE